MNIFYISVPSLEVFKVVDSLAKQLTVSCCGLDGGSGGEGMGDDSLGDPGLSSIEGLLEGISSFSYVCIPQALPFVVYNSHLDDKGEASKLACRGTSDMSGGWRWGRSWWPALCDPPLIPTRSISYVHFRY